MGGSSWRADLPVDQIGIGSTCSEETGAGGHHGRSTGKAPKGQTAIEEGPYQQIYMAHKEKMVHKGQDMNYVRHFSVEGVWAAMKGAEWGKGPSAGWPPSFLLQCILGDSPSHGHNGGIESRTLWNEVA